MNEIEKRTEMNIELHQEPGSNTLRISGQALIKLKSKSITALHSDETARVLKCVKNFILAIDDLEFKR